MIAFIELTDPITGKKSMLNLNRVDYIQENYGQVELRIGTKNCRPKESYEEIQQKIRDVMVSTS